MRQIPSSQKNKTKTKLKSIHPIHPFNLKKKKIFQISGEKRGGEEQAVTTEIKQVKMVTQLQYYVQR